MKVSADLCARSCFQGGRLLDVLGSHQFLTSSHVWERDKAFLRSVLVGESGMAFFWGECVARWFLAGFVVVQMVVVIFSGIVFTLLLLRYVKILSFMIL